MRAECVHLKGRLRDLCEGVGFDGRPNPSQDASDAYRAKIGLTPIVVESPGAVVYVPKPKKPKRIPKTPLPPLKPTVSKIGTRLARIFAEKVAAVPCGDCKNAIVRLNQMTVAEVQAGRDKIIADILSRAARATPTWLKGVAISADQFLSRQFTSIGIEQTGYTGYLIGVYIDRACDEEAVDNAHSS